MIATYNERSNIERLIADLMDTSISPHVTIVDDNSPDGTGQAVRECMERYPGRVSLIERSGKLGYGSAQIEEIISYAVGHGTIGNAPGINHTTLIGHGFGQAQIDKIEAWINQGALDN